MVSIVVRMKSRTASYKVDNIVKAREHAHRIITQGFRCREKVGSVFFKTVKKIAVYYPVHQILKVEFAEEGNDKNAL